MNVVLLALICFVGVQTSIATGPSQMYAGAISADSANNVPVRVRGLVAQNSLDQMLLILDGRVVPGAEIVEGERIGALSSLNSAQQGQTVPPTSDVREVAILSPCKARIEEVYCVSNTVVAAENNNGAMSPKYILSFSCVNYPGQLKMNRRADYEGLLEVAIVSKDGHLVVDAPDSEYVQEGGVLLGIWADNQLFLRYEATGAIHSVQTVYPKSQMMNQRFGEGVTLLRFELQAPTAPQSVSPPAQTDYLSQGEPPKEISVSAQEQSEREASKEPSVSDIEMDQSIQPLDTNPNNQEATPESGHLEDLEADAEGADTAPGEESPSKLPIEVALDNSAITYSIMMRNHLRKSRLHNVIQDLDLPYQKPKWIARAPCSGVITSRMLGPGLKRIAQGTVYASIECSSKKKREGSQGARGQEIHLIMPFSMKIGQIKADFRETDKEGLYSARVSKNQCILSGKLVQESKDIPAHVIYGKFQLVTAPCSGVLRITTQVGTSVKKRDSIFHVDCADSPRDPIMHGVTTRAGLVTKFFREDGTDAKTGEAIAIVRNNWKILTSPCDGILMYTEGPGLAKTGTNIAVVICNDDKSRRKNIQATKPFMILENILPNPSFVTRGQPVVIVDASKLAWDVSDELDNSNTISKVYSPSNTKNNIKDSKLPPGVLIQNVASPCSGHLFREMQLKVGSQIDENAIFARIKCNKKKQYSLVSGKTAIILQNSVYEQLGAEMINNYEPETFQVSKGSSIIQIMFIDNLKHHVITSPCDGYGYTFNSVGNKVSKGKYFAAIQCRDEKNNKKTQKIKAVKDMSIVSSYISFKKKFFKGDPLFITVESN
ncbi:hypothetical protein OJ253_964 [Cryptosporidium canis]|uniref:Uncharacterized protein n=1 Tax=Cryptosporidium canis TaxID=195482 RepID=A0A9D5DHT2_9CRYT|nr:hypothetical protein OJ253_964 [Cryptosporidium canis]